MTWLQPYPDTWIEQLGDAAPGPAARFETHEAVELAFIAALQQLPPRQTAVLILADVLGFSTADVLGFSTAEVAGMLDSTATAVKGALQRARASLARHRPGSAHDPSGGRGSAAEHDLARRFAACFTAGDIDSVVALLTDDAWLTMPPAPHEYLGSKAIAAFLRARSDWHDRHPLTLVPTRANGQPAFGCYLSHPDARIELPTGVLVLTMFRDRVSRITQFLDDNLPLRFGLPRI